MTAEPAFLPLFPNEVSVLRQGLSVLFPRLIEYGHLGSGTATEAEFIAMEEIEGVELKALLGSGRVPLYQAIEITMQTLYGLNSLHEHNIVHRDIKPANIMIESAGRVRLIDFGIACETGHTDPDGMVVGTPSYLSPDQVKSLPITPLSDLYSLGVVFYEMVAGYNPNNPQNSNNWLKVIPRIGQSDVPPLPVAAVQERFSPADRSTLSEKINAAHAEFSRILRQMTRVDPALRFQNATEVIEQLERLMPLAWELEQYERV